jgi:hypothetical protein
MSQKQVMQAAVVEFGSVGYAKQVNRVIPLMIVVHCVRQCSAINVLHHFLFVRCYLILKKIV